MSFDTPRDRLVWDVGHQAYPHKILTGRRDRIRTHPPGRRPFRFHQARGERIRSVRRRAFLDLDLGRASAWRWRAISKGEKHNVVCVIGDGAMSAGMAYEAMNNAGASDERLIVILNDNDMSIAPPVGAMSAYLARLVSGKTYLKIRDFGKQLARASAEIHRIFGCSARRNIRAAFWTGGTLFEELGFYYVGPIDGHNLDHLLPVLKNIRDAERRTDPRPCRHAEGQRLSRRPKRRPTNIMAWSKFDVATGAQAKSKAQAPQYTKVFAESLIKEARKDDKIVAITAAMPSGTGLDLFAEEFPNALLRCRHCRAACGDFCRGPCERRLQAVCGDLLDVPAARLRSGGARRRDPIAAGALCHRSRRTGRRGWTDACGLI